MNTTHTLAAWQTVIMAECISTCIWRIWFMKVVPTRTMEMKNPQIPHARWSGKTPCHFTSLFCRSANRPCRRKKKNSIGPKRETTWQIAIVHSTCSYVDKLKVTSGVKEHIRLAAESTLLTLIAQCCNHTHRQIVFCLAGQFLDYFW